MTAWFVLQRANGWLVAVLMVLTVMLCLTDVWLVTGALLLATTAILHGWWSMARQHELAIVEILRLRAHIHEFSRMQGRFVGNLAQEIKNPLSVVLGEVEYLHLHCEDATAVRGITKGIAVEVRHLSDLVDIFLQVPRRL